MPFSFGQRSRARLSTCHPRLVEVAERAIIRTPIDFTIIHGFRDRELQNELVAQGLSKTPWPKSQHNFRILQGGGESYIPQAKALDFGPWINGTVPWDDELAFARVAGVFDACAAELGIEIEWGGDWDDDGSSTDQSFMDLGHIQLAGS